MTCFPAFNAATAISSGTPAHVDDVVVTAITVASPFPPIAIRISRQPPGRPLITAADTRMSMSTPRSKTRPTVRQACECTAPMNEYPIMPTPSDEPPISSLHPSNQAHAAIRIRPCIPVILGVPLPVNRFSVSGAA